MEILYALCLGDAKAGEACGYIQVLCICFVYAFLSYFGLRASRNVYIGDV